MTRRSRTRRTSRTTIASHPFGCDHPSKGGALLVVAVANFDFVLGLQGIQHIVEFAVVQPAMLAVEIPDPHAVCFFLNTGQHVGAISLECGASESIDQLERAGKPALADGTCRFEVCEA